MNIDPDKENCLLRRRMAADMNIMPGFHVVRATAQELEQLRALRLESIAISPGAFGVTQSDEEKITDIQWSTRINSELWLLARKENVAVAIARGWKLNETDCVLSSLFVHPSQRGHGIAHALIDEVHEWMTNEGAVNSLLRVIDGNEDAARLYESYGYQRTGVYEPLQRDPNTYEAEYALDLSLLAKSA